MQLINAVFCITILVSTTVTLVSTHYTLKIQCVKLSQCAKFGTLTLRVLTCETRILKTVRNDLCSQAALQHSIHIQRQSNENAMQHCQIQNPRLIQGHTCCLCLIITQSQSHKLSIHLQKCSQPKVQIRSPTIYVNILAVYTLH